MKNVLHCQRVFVLFAYCDRLVFLKGGRVFVLNIEPPRRHCNYYLRRSSELKHQGADAIRFLFVLMVHKTLLNNSSNQDCCLIF